MRGLVDVVGEYAESVARGGLPAGRRSCAVRAVSDTVGNMMLAADQPVADLVTEVAGRWGSADVATVVGRSQRFPPGSAAFVNGTLAHCMDFDDTHLPSVLHPSASVVPAALAVAEETGAGGPALLDAVAVGVEVCVRLGMAGYDRELGNSIFFERGQHASSICGAIGSAVAATMLSGGDAGTLADAVAIAASMGSGVLEANRTGGSVKRIHTGWAAHCGVSAAQLATAGLTGPPTVLEGRFGFFQAFCGDRAVPEIVTADLGAHWYSESLHIKPYPCNHFTHTGIDAALELRARGVTPDDIVAIEAGVPQPVLRTIAEPPAVKAVPESGYAAAFSGPYTIASALVGGGGLGLYLEDFTDEAARRPEVLALAAKVSCHADAACTADFPDQFPTVLTARLRDGRTERVAVMTNRGGPHRPLSQAELDLKFDLGTRTRCDGATSRALREEIRSLTGPATARTVLRLITLATTSTEARDGR
ncbi:MmgE/PrpD family protein [Streptomyces sp. NBC_01766]|uniref:MmgE/PrpD family protein n=1 Tax=Streptomyces sp. NBC_01766 TaxID=2975936 RepID=UPI002DDA071E|nr:MmgE/PrpD family protein [Streptomyces sp. NBC_01766]WSC19701.1 MmgE/PrpD family protein [Streptomyces sp. NBC_01766]